MKKLTIVIVSYNVRYYAEQCIRSVLKAVEGVDAEIWVVDNHSRDDSVAYLHERFPEITIVSVNHNLGFSRANNRAIGQTESEYLLLLNPDTIVGEQTIKDTLNFMDKHPDAGGAGVKMLTSTGEKAKESRRGIPSPITAFYKMCGLCSRYPKHPKFGKYYMCGMPWDVEGEIEIVSGAYFMLRRRALEEVGLLDEDYFMYGEDIDLSYRLLKGGWKNWYIPTSILHYKGESTQKTSFRYVHVFYDSMLIFLRKHFRHLSFFILLPLKLAVWFKAFITLLSLVPSMIRKMLGFNIVRKEEQPEYLFISQQANMGKCQKLARVKGLQAQFVEGCSQSLPDGHLSIEMMAPKKSLLYVVYDISAYTMQDIFSIMERSANDNVRLGTFNPENNVLITDQEVLYE